MNEYARAMFDIKIHPSLLDIIFAVRFGTVTNEKKEE